MSFFSLRFKLWHYHFVQCKEYIIWIASVKHTGPIDRPTVYSEWTQPSTPIKSQSLDMWTCPVGFQPVLFSSIHNSSIEKLDLENAEIVVGISFIYHVGASWNFLSILSGSRDIPRGDYSTPDSGMCWKNSTAGTLHVKLYFSCNHGFEEMDERFQQTMQQNRSQQIDWWYLF
jgi:hypothetical protein